MENTQRNALPSRESAWGLLCEYTRSENLRKHMLAVEACMRAYAKKFGEDEHEYSLAGLLHDFDYEKYPLPEGFAQRGSALASGGNDPVSAGSSPAPAGHPFVGEKILAERGYPEHIRRAIRSHDDYSGVSPSPRMEQAWIPGHALAGSIRAPA